MLCDICLNDSCNLYLHSFVSIVKHKQQVVRLTCSRVRGALQNFLALAVTYWFLTQKVYSWCYESYNMFRTVLIQFCICICWSVLFVVYLYLFFDMLSLFNGFVDWTYQLAARNKCFELWTCPDIDGPAEMVILPKGAIQDEQKADFRRFWHHCEGQWNDPRSIAPFVQGLATGQTGPLYGPLGKRCAQRCGQQKCFNHSPCERQETLQHQRLATCGLCTFGQNVQEEKGGVLQLIIYW